MLKKKGISLAEWRILDKVAQSNFATPTKISKQLNLAASQISRALELLEAKGFISRIRSVENCDRRLVKLECNKEGRELWTYGKRMGKEVVVKLGLH
jgi:DNA-binding MarR family transcriptional regulator